MLLGHRERSPRSAFGVALSPSIRIPQAVLAFAVSLSILGLALGPLLLAWGRGRVLPSAAILGFTLGLVPSVVLLRLLPHVYEEGGPITLVFLTLGYGALWIAERRRHKSLGSVSVAVALPALVIHAMADGATLGIVLGQNANVQSGSLLASALLIHRLPEGLFVARAVAPESGWAKVAIWIAALALATVFGSILGERLLAFAPPTVFHAIVALGLGAVLRLATHSHEPTPSSRSSLAVFVAALVGGIALNLAVPSAALAEVHAGPAKAMWPAVVFGITALVFVMASGLVRFAPKTWLSRLGIAEPACENDHPHDETATTPPP